MEEVILESFGRTPRRQQIISRHTHQKFVRVTRDEENIVSILPLSKEILENPDGQFLMSATKMESNSQEDLSGIEYVRTNQAPGSSALRSKKEGDSLLDNVRPATDEHTTL